MTRHAPTLLAAACFWCAATGPLAAQVRIDVELENRAMLEFESVVATVTLHNDAETPIVIGATDFNAKLEIVLSRQNLTSEESEATRKRPIVRSLVILPGDTRKELVEVSTLFDLREPGGYRLSVEVVHEDIRYVAREQIFDVVSGIELASITHPMPGYRNTKLTYSLRYWARASSEHLFLVIRDETARMSYGTFDLGRVIRFVAPKMTYARDGVLTVVHQSGRERHTRSVFKVTGEGVQFAEQTQHLPSGKPYPTTDTPVGIEREKPPTAR